MDLCKFWFSCFCEMGSNFHVQRKLECGLFNLPKRAFYLYNMTGCRSEFKMYRFKAMADSLAS